MQELLRQQIDPTQEIGYLIGGATTKERIRELEVARQHEA